MILIQLMLATDSFLGKGERPKGLASRRCSPLQNMSLPELDLKSYITEAQGGETN
ncbi:MAG: hypothetical protein AAF298_12180 [Cyanobacteria bacterium P01_A01_bin.40]